MPARFGTEVVARLLGLRTNHPADEDSLELLPNDPATRAEAAYSAAAVLHFGGWEVAGVQSLADSFALPQLSAWQIRILDTAVARIGMPYVWGGTSDGPEVDVRRPGARRLRLLRLRLARLQAPELPGRGQPRLGPARAHHLS